MLRLGYGLIFSGGGVNRKCEGVGKTLLSSWFYGDFEVMQLQSAWSKYERAWVIFSVASCLILVDSKLALRNPAVSCLLFSWAHTHLCAHVC